MQDPFAGKTVAVIGSARSGLACAEMLAGHGARVRIYDNKPAEELASAIESAERMGVELRLGGALVDYGEIDLLVTSPGVPRGASVLTEAVSAGVEVIGEIEAAYRAAKAPILAITGTNGKTTTTVLLGEIMKAAGLETYIAGNVAAGEIALPLSRAADRAPGGAVIVAEISSFQLEWISRFRPKIAALLNITADHSDRQTRQEYVEAKWRIFENQRAADHAVLSRTLAGDPRAASVAARKWVFGPPESEENDAQQVDGAIFVRRDASGSGAWQQICCVDDLKLPGAHNLENVLAASAMAAAFGVGIDPIRRAVIGFTGVVHRLEYVDTIDGVRYINNSMCTNAAAVDRSLEALPEHKTVIMGGVFKGDADELADVARAVARRGVSRVILIGQSAGRIDSALREQGYDRIRHAESLAAAVSQAQQEAMSGQSVMLAPGCASFDMFKDFEDRGDQFKRLVKSLGGKHERQQDEQYSRAGAGK